MKVVILAGGLGTRISEETDIKPKPMVEIGGMPILWHIMKIYSHYGYNDFIICLGYKGNYIKEWFNNYYLNHSDVTFDFEKNDVSYHKSIGEKWRVTLVDTGEQTMTGGRIKRIKDHIGNETFMLTYGDGVGDINIDELVKFHKDNKAEATVTAVMTEGRFGVVEMDDANVVTNFSEKTDTHRISGGFFVFEPTIFDHITGGDEEMFEKGPMEKLSKLSQLKAYMHNGFWKPMDTLNDKRRLDAMWASGKAPWKIWA